MNLFSVRQHHRGKSQSSWKNSLSAATATAMLSTYVIWIYPIVRKYGWKGVWHYLRAGDPHSPQVRNSMKILRSIAAHLDEKEKALIKIEDIITRPSLYILSGAVLHISRKLYNRSIPTHADLQKALAGLKHDLNRLAIQVNQVVPAVGITATKKELLGRVAKMKGRADALISAYKSV
jgi:hypothetical protein